VSVDVTKGSSVPLDSAGTSLTRVTVGLGWDPAAPGAQEIDLDASAIALGADGLAPSREFFVFFNNLSSPRGEIAHRGDNLTGEGSGDDEQIEVQLDALSSAITRIVFPVTIHNADFRQQDFGHVRNAFIRVVDSARSAELARFNLSTDAATETGMLFGELYRDAAGWHFRALGQGRVTGLAGIAREYGVDV
jgi:tellurium resistance protein TerD